MLYVYSITDVMIVEVPHFLNISYTTGYKNRIPPLVENKIQIPNQVGGNRIPP